ncbi:hypothetical protein BGY98DRAFT_1133295 [Russula aff. rugulosa BPL654]|nr:hypothetical protein BGY98DRAFT_1133295 [Russula aff. rugulosa BPL654]
MGAVMGAEAKRGEAKREYTEGIAAACPLGGESDDHKLRNAKTRDFLGKATSFTGVIRLKQGVSPQNVYIDPDRESQSSLMRATTLNRSRGSASDVEPVGGLARAKTTIDVAPVARGRHAATVLNRSNTANAVSRMNRTGLPTRALTVRKPGVNDVAPASVSPKPKTSPETSDFYDNLMDSYSQPSPPPKPGQGNNDRIANWARNNVPGPALPVSREPNAFGGSTRSGTIKRRLTRRTIRVRIHCDGDVRGMALNPEVPYLEFMQRVAAKFETTVQSIALKFRDEDGGTVSLRDESDYELAIEAARESAKGRPEDKPELWCEIK